MHMHWIDWGIVAALLGVLIWGAATTRRHARSVSGFLVAQRCGGRYIIAVADNMAQLGVISLVWFFELNYQVGFTSLWWGLMEGPAAIVMALSGWVIYRFRQTRALTLAQFFEMRYSRNLRIFAGLVAYLAGIINFAIFPSVGARFFIALCGLPEQVAFAGIEVGMYPLMMILLLAISLVLLLAGGQIAVMVTDFLQGVFCNVVFIVLTVFLLMTFGWDRISDTLLAAPPGQSLVNPFDIGAEKHFDFWYYAIGVLILFYCAQGWQGTQGYKCSALNAHEAKMAGIIGAWRFRVLMLVVIVVPMCVRTMLQHADFTEQAAVVQASLHGVTSEALRNQLRTPIALAVLLPAGLLGAVCAAMLGAFISTHDSYLHSWGAILVQDVILPLRRRPLTPRQHLLWLRVSIFAVAVFIFLVSLFFHHAQYIAMFCALTASVFVAGAGSVIIGGLYWKRGTTAGAWAAMITGMYAALAGIVIKQISPILLIVIGKLPLAGPFARTLHWLREHLTGQEMSFFAIVLAVTVYVLVSLLGPRSVHDMDRLLHRGKYASAGETATSFRDATTWLQRLGFTRDFTGTDRVITYITVGWPLVWTVIFIVGTGYCLTYGASAAAWMTYWRWWTWFILACGVVVTVWFTIGGVRDMRRLYRELGTRRIDTTDDGRVAESASSA